MRLTVPATAINDLVFMSMATVDTMPPKADYNTGEQKLSPDNKPLYNARGLTAIGTDNDGNATGADNSVSLALTTPKPIKMGVLYRLTGQSTITHYVQSNGRLGVSIIADSVEPVQVRNNNQ